MQLEDASFARTIFEINELRGIRGKALTMSGYVIVNGETRSRRSR